MEMDWGVVLVAGFAALPSTIAALAALRESKKTTEEVVKTKEAVVTTHDAVNGKMDKLIKLTAAVNYAEGVSAGNGDKVSPRVREVLKVAEAAEVESLAKADAEAKETAKADAEGKAKTDEGK